jgi:hypothetical protein
LTKRLVERAMSAELTDHLGYELHQEPPGGSGNTRNGSTAKTLATEHGPVRIETPRDHKGSFEPQIVRKGQDDKILALYSRGLSTRDIEAHLAEIYGVKVGRDLISPVTDAVMDDVRAWLTQRGTREEPGTQSQSDRDGVGRAKHEPSGDEESVGELAHDNSWGQERYAPLREQAQHALCPELD